MEGVDRRGAEGAGHVADGFVLGGAKVPEESGLAGKPDRGCVGEDGEDDSVEEDAPLGPVETTNGVTEELQGFEGGASTVCHDADVVVPIELVIEEDPQVADDPVFQSA